VPPVDWLDAHIKQARGESLMTEMIEPLRRRVLQNMAAINALSIVGANWTTEDNTLVGYALPYVQLDQYYASNRQLPPGGVTSLIVARGNQTNIQQATLNQQGFPTGSLNLPFRWDVVGLEQMDHQ
jgi:hypothetical protein